MAPRNKDDIGLAPETPVRAEYERDFYSWLMEQARFVREGRFDALDRDNLAEEIESLGREQFDKLVSALRVLMLHILKWDHQPERRSRSWTVSIRTQRNRVGDVLADNPRLKPRLQEAIDRAYRDARIEAGEETGLDENVFPVACPYSFEDITGRPFHWQGDPRSRTQ
jgi:Domain of unknown function DUF29